MKFKAAVVVSILIMISSFGTSSHSNTGDYEVGEDYFDAVEVEVRDFSDEINGIDFKTQSNGFSSDYETDGCYITAYTGDGEDRHVIDYEPGSEIKKSNPMDVTGSSVVNYGSDRYNFFDDEFRDFGWKAFTNDMSGNDFVVNQDEVQLKHQILCHDRNPTGGNWVVCNEDARNHKFKEDLREGYTTADGNYYQCKSDGDNWVQVSEEEAAEISLSITRPSEEVEQVEEGEVVSENRIKVVDSEGTDITEEVETDGSLDVGSSVQNTQVGYTWENYDSLGSNYKQYYVDETEGDGGKQFYITAVYKDAVTSNTFDIKSFENFQIQDVSHNGPVQQGEEATFTATISNEADVSGEQQVSLRIGDETVDTIQVQKDANTVSDEELVWETSSTVGGNYIYTVETEDDTAEGEIEILGETDSAGRGRIAQRFFDYGQGVDLTEVPVGFKLEGVESQWSQAYRTGTDRVTVEGPFGVERQVGSNLIVDAECWLGDRGSRPDSSGEKTRVSRSVPNLDDVWVTMNVPDRTGVDNNTYSCVYGFRHRIPVSAVPEGENVDTFYTNSLPLNPDTTWLVEGTNDEGNVDVDTEPSIDASETSIPGPSGSTPGITNGFQGWEWYPGSEGFASETRNPLQWLRAKFS